MYRDIDELLDRISELQNRLEVAFDEARVRFRYSLEGGRVRFTREVRELQRRYRVSSLRYLMEADLASVITAPVIYGMIVPLLVMDASFTLYQHICFRAYGVPRVSRRDYMVNDRHRLAYLNAIEKLNCAYCGYGNGVVAYVREIISRTEQYWCPVRHARHIRGAHERYPRFLAYGDAEHWQSGLEQMRQQLRAEGRSVDHDTAGGGQ